MRDPILTLTTDFGLSDHYVGAMKGVILGICPQAQIVDITHGVAPYEIAEGAYVIAQAYPCFPQGTIHVIVVDPGVGSARRPILLEAAGQFFIAPDNGVLAMVMTACDRYKVRLISNDRLFRHPVSRTFHGRDIFSPVAAHLGAGVPPPYVGDSIEDYLRPAFQKPERTGKRTWTGRILKIDRFGNVITNFHREGFPDLERRNYAMRLGPREVTVLVRSYSESSPGEVFLIFGSSGYLEVSVNQGSAAKAIGCQTGAPVELLIW